MEPISEPIRRRYADYLAEEARAAPIPLPVPEGRPRPGHGTVFVLPGSPPGQPARADAWEARWIDEYDEPGVHGQLAGTESFEGTRAEVLAWARARPARVRVMPVEVDPYWVPLPDDDGNVVS
jgi:hypothetical protein